MTITAAAAIVALAGVVLLIVWAARRWNLGQLFAFALLLPVIALTAVIAHQGCYDVHTPVCAPVTAKQACRGQIGDAADLFARSYGSAPKPTHCRR